MTSLSRQAKAVAAVLVTFLVQVQVYVGQGGVDELKAVTLGQWISVVVFTASAYGIVYSVPNTGVQLPAPAPAVPAAAIVGAPVIDPPGVAP